VREVANRSRAVIPYETLTRRGDELGEPISEQVVLVRPFLSDYGLDEDAESITIARAFCFYEIKE
jgi:hypothetical protein